MYRPRIRTAVNMSMAISKTVDDSRCFYNLEMRLVKKVQRSLA